MLRREAVLKTDVNYFIDDCRTISFVPACRMYTWKKHNQGGEKPFLSFLNHVSREQLGNMWWWGVEVDQITKKTSNPKCRLYWCLIEFIDWRCSQSCWYFRPLLWTSAPLTFSLVHLPPSTPPFPVWISTGECTVCTGGGGWPQTDKHLPASPFTVQFL